jgi:signal transduction histidine kinase
MLMSLCGQARGAEPLPPILTTVDQVRQLPAEEAMKGLPVRLRGVISYRAAGHSLLFLQDATGGIYVHPGQLPVELRELTAGVELELEGITAMGRFAPQVEGRGGTVLGAAPLPEPVWVSADQLGDPRHHSQRIELTAVVRSVQAPSPGPDLQAETVLVLGASAGRFAAVLYGSEARDPALTNLVGALVRVRGVFGSIFNSRRQLVGMRLFVNSARDVVVEQSGGSDPFAAPPRSIASLMQYEPSAATPSRLHVQGVVTLVTEDGFFLEDEAAGVKVLMPVPPALQAGDLADVVGFPTWGGWSPVLEDAQAKVRGRIPLPSPPVITVQQAIKGDFCYRRVRMEALVLQAPRHVQQPTLVLQAGEEVFLARLAPNLDPGAFRFPEGSWVQLTGIGINQIRPETSTDAARASENLIQRAALFHLLVGAPGDVVALREPSWWTVSRLLGVLAAVVFLLVAVLAWGMLLRRQVAAQTRIIRERLARETVYEERHRIARELHDTLEQEMTGIAMHLDAAGAMLVPAPETARQSLATARALLDRSRAESRRSIWELRSTALEDGGLAAAFAELARTLPEPELPRLEFSVTGTPRRLPARTETHLLRIGHEALTNALKHSQARHITLALAFGEADVSIQVKDDGQGFEVADGKLPSGRFGLLGMKERAAKIQARLEIQSQPGVGTRVLVSLPTIKEAAAPQREWNPQNRTPNSE